ncbi:MAG: patatin-like phospholipase family protein [Flavobacteriales bacterium]|nr:patatin-like phospholipase family protein [Flavobacteriales bacterium]
MIESTLRRFLNLQLENFLGISDVDFLESLIDRLHISELNCGDVLFRKGDPSDELYFLILGKMRAYDTDSTHLTRKLGEIHYGESVGEMGFLSGDKRSASVVALRRSIVAGMSSEVFRDICARKPEINNVLNTFLIKRLRRANTIDFIRRSDQRSVMTFSPMQGTLNRSTHDTVLQMLLERKHVCTLSSPDDPGKLRESIVQNERNFRHCIFSTAQSNEMAAQICGASDTLVVFATEDQVEEVSQYLSTALISDSQRNTIDLYLVLSYEPSAIPVVAPKWLKLFAPGRIFKVRKDNLPDLQRISRLLTGEGTGLALSGGGAHGFAHLGVLKALKECNIPIDFVCGSSVGAIMAAGIAMDWSLEDILAKVRQDISMNNPLNDYSIPFPFTSILKGFRMEARLKRHFNRNTQDTWINYLCLASNYQTAQVEKLDTGPLYKNIAASISIPGILPPKIVDQKYLLDGGVLENVPVLSLREVFNGRIITVDLSFVKKFDVLETEVPGPFQILVNKLNPFAAKIKYPRLMNVVMKSLTLSSVQQQQVYRAASDIYINPRIRRGFLAWKAFDQIVEEGYQAARKVLSEHGLSNSTAE